MDRRFVVPRRPHKTLALLSSIAEALSDPGATVAVFCPNNERGTALLEQLPVELRARVRICVPGGGGRRPNAFRFPETKSVRCSCGVVLRSAEEYESHWCPGVERELEMRRRLKGR